MNIVKQILIYLFWVLLALLSGMFYFRLLIGSKIESPKGVLELLFNIFYDIALIQVGLVIGSIIAFLFVLLDFAYLKRKLKDKKSLISYRLVLLAVIVVVVALIHYFLEKIIDVI